MGLAFAIPLIFGGLSPNSAIYRQSIAIGQAAARISAEHQAAEEAACMSGTAPPQLQLVEATGKARDLISAYWKKAGAGAPADVRPLFHSGVKPDWTVGDAAFLFSVGGTAKADSAALKTLEDRFAKIGMRLDETRLNFTRSGDGKSAVGQWLVLNSADRPGGIIEVNFARRKKAWKMMKIAWSGDSIAFRHLRQFCHAPGDVMPYRLSTLQSARVAAEERLLKARKVAEEKDAAVLAASTPALKALAEQEAERAAKALAQADAHAAEIEARQAEALETQRLQQAEDAGGPGVPSRRGI